MLLLLSACGRDAPLQPESGRRLPPRPPARVVNPLCTGSGQVHPGDTLTASVTWPASGNPHQVTSTVVVQPGATLTIEPGAVLCFGAGAGLRSNGGRLFARGQAAAPIVFTAYDTAQGWIGIDLQGTPSLGSQIRHARVEYVDTGHVAITSTGHLVFVDTSVVRQSGAGVWLWGRSSRLGWSRVDTTTNAALSAVELGDSARFQSSVIQSAAGVGMLIDGMTDVRLVGSGNRVEGSGDVGIRVTPMAVIGSDGSSRATVTGGQSYPIEASISQFQRLYTSTASNQDHLKGNARDTVVMLGGTLNASLYVRTGLPWHVKGSIVVDSGGVLAGQARSLIVMDSALLIAAQSGGRLQLRGTRASPLVVTAADPAHGWRGIVLFGAPDTPSSIANARVEHVDPLWTAVTALDSHAVKIDSVVLRQVGRAVSLLSPGSRLTRSRVDTTLSASSPAVELGADAILESTLIRGSAGYGVAIQSASVQVQSCDIRGSASGGIYMFVAAPVHNCNLSNYANVGVWNFDTATADVTGTWWGDPGGPTAPGADYAYGPLTYTPWRTTPYVLPYVP
ncbi:MAG TPA: hypothetical protein VFJ82_26850 [Longimicrobium sp.]|nr:hypothetical protein [Longimicrobium sp.]